VRPTPDLPSSAGVGEPTGGVEDGGGEPLGVGAAHQVSGVELEDGSVESLGELVLAAQGDHPVACRGDHDRGRSGRRPSRGW
jgi:hypothetical protein